MSDKVYNLIKAICLIVIACTSVYIAMEIDDIDGRLFDIARVIGNK
ncbi:MAG: hypothetical protein KKF57_12710 [Firmicutes bacterium]|nr:hypothetical protein [Bacillota bacterium]